MLTSWNRRRRRETSRRKSKSKNPSLLATVCLISTLTGSVSALFGLGDKRFKYEGLIDSGSLGLGNIDGSVAAFGDWNGDQFLDVFVLSSDRSKVNVHLWDHASFTFQSSPITSIKASSSITSSGFSIVNVVPNDFDYDGRMDLMLMLQNERDGSGETKMEIWIGKQGGQVATDPISLPSSTSSHPITLDATGSMRTDLLAHEFISSSTSELSLWRNLFKQTDENGSQTSGFKIEKAPLLSSKAKGCKLANPHSSSFIDLNGDCLADLFLVCSPTSSSSNSNQNSYQIWTSTPNESTNNNKKGKNNPNSEFTGAGFKLSREGLLPPNSGSFSFSDMDRDGTIDIVFPTCDRGQDENGLGKGECFINIAYNKQVGLCSSKGGLTSGGGGVGGNGFRNQSLSLENERDFEESRDVKLLGCRRTEELCSADDDFKFDFSQEALTRIPVSSLLSSNTSKLLLTDIFTAPSTPLPLSLGDHNKDGYPDLVLLVSDTSIKSKIPETRAHLLTSIPCGNPPSSNPFATKPPTKPGCKNDATLEDGTRTLKVEKEGSGVLNGIKDIRRASWIDVDEDGTLDLLLQRLPEGISEGKWSSSDKSRRRITFIQNNYFHDAFFLKILTLNGACLGYCEPSSTTTTSTLSSSEKYRPWGNNYGGASYKFTVLDTNGIRKAQQVGQLSSTSYSSLLTSYSYIGLGRTNNYVENLFVGSTRKDRKSKESLDLDYLSMEGVIPNSQVVVAPWQGLNGELNGGSENWGKELYLQPGDWIPWVTVVLLTTILGLAILVAVLHVNERREDEKERKRAVHAINFDAL